MHQTDIELYKIYGNGKGLFRRVLKVSMEVSPKSHKLSKCVSYVQSRSVESCLSNVSQSDIKIMTIHKFCGWSKNKFNGDYE